VLLKLLVGIAFAGLLALVLVNALRPDLFRFESVGVTTHPSVLSALDARVAALHLLSDAKLLELPEDQTERAQLDGRDVLFQITRTHPAEGVTQVVVVLVAKEASGLFARPVHVAARGFRTGPNQERVPLTDAELTELAMTADASPFYSGSRLPTQ